MHIEKVIFSIFLIYEQCFPTIEEGYRPLSKVWIFFSTPYPPLPYHDGICCAAWDRSNVSSKSEGLGYRISRSTRTGTAESQPKLRMRSTNASS